MADDKEKSEKESAEKAAAEKAKKKEKAEKHKAENAKAEKEASQSSKKSKVKEDSPPVEGIYPRFRTRYKAEIVPKLVEEFKFKSAMQVPEIKKIVINAGLGQKAIANIKIIDQAVKDISAIAGQRPVSTKSKLAIAAFKLRAGLPIGVTVTLRGNRMYEFLDRLITLALPRIRDFRGVSDKGFDGHGNFTMGLKEQIVFPEVQYDTAEGAFGMNITFVTSAKTDDQGRALLKHFGFPFRKRQPSQKAA